MKWIKVDTAFDGIRSDPRFADCYDASALDPGSLPRQKYLTHSFQQAISSAT
jgi:hypothetical protein